MTPERHLFNDSQGSEVVVHNENPQTSRKFFRNRLLNSSSTTAFAGAVAAYTSGHARLCHSLQSSHCSKNRQSKTIDNQNLYLVSEIRHIRRKRARQLENRRKREPKP